MVDNTEHNSKPSFLKSETILIAKLRTNKKIPTSNKIPGYFSASDHSVKIKNGLKSTALRPSIAGWMG